MPLPWDNFDMDATITLSVMPRIAERFATEDAARRKYLELQLQLRLYEMLFGPDERTLFQVMDDLSRNAQASGLTPEILQDILDETP